mmetsp:Transcript_28732/g.58997  ORF Transcript_28732/g.58997 Transcript_28732/m.58997 type:complete len:853 (-) Transcript_28732:12-2570(-)
MGSASSTQRSATSGYPAGRRNRNRPSNGNSPSVTGYGTTGVITGQQRLSSSDTITTTMNGGVTRGRVVSTNNNTINSVGRSAPASVGGRPTVVSPAPSSPVQHPLAATHSRPGAYSVSREGSGPTQVFRVRIPDEVRPGQEFQVIAGSRTVRVRCPMESRGGQYLQITVPPDPVVRQNHQGMAVLTSATGSEGGGAVLMRAEVAEANEQQHQQQQQQQHQQNQLHHQPNPPAQQQTYMVTVPAGIRPGMQFAVDVEGQRMMVTCPANVQAGMNLRILPPPAPTQSTSLDRPPEQQNSVSTPPRPPLMQMFEVVVPAGVRPNQQFSLLANGQRVLVTCPPNVGPGRKIRFQLPISHNDASTVQLSYEKIKDGWTRTIRVTDMKFQWVRMDENGEIDVVTQERFDVKHSAYTRKLHFLEGNDPRMRTGKLSLVTANESSVDSSVERNGREVVGYWEIAAAHQRGSYEEKSAWFQEICIKRLRVEWSEGHMRMNVRRAHLLHDSIDAVMSLGREDMRKIWRFEFIGETGVDAGGLAREWFQLVTEACFDPDMGLWLSSSTNQMAMRINPASEISCPEDHLIYFRFLGRVMGKALFDGQLVSGHMVRHMYKHILGWPITFDDLELADEEYYNSLSSLLKVDDVGAMCLDFTFTEDALGTNKVVELMEGGSNVDVTNENLPEFLQSNLKYHLMDRVKPQLTELLLGFYDVVPEPLLTIFDFQELELLMCGLPTIDIDDWMKYTIYQGEYEAKGASSKTCKWFWDIVRNEFDQETRARLLQFVTGTSGVPSRGFSVLQGNDGNIRQFCINGVSKDFTLYPKAHTCFNRIDLPVYSSKDELREKLTVAVATSATGFDIE